MTSLFRIAASLVVPDRCAICGRWAAVDTRHVCPPCRASLIAPSPTPPDGVATLLAAASFEGPLRAGILAMKYHRQPWRARGLASLICETPETAALLVGVAGICAAPTTWARVRERGFDQGELLAASVARHAAIPRTACLLRRAAGLAPQTGQGRDERALVASAMHASRSVTGIWVVVDDVVTTGATLSACAAALFDAGATEVRALTVAATPGPGPAAALLDASDAALVR